MKRVLSLWLPNWPVQWRSADRPPGDGPALVVHGPADRGKVRVIACSRAARKRGVKPGMLLAEAQALWPMSATGAVRFEPHDPAADRQGLRDLARWCLQFSPTVGVDDGESPDGLLADATGCGHGDGGEAEFAAEAVAALAARGHYAFAAVADTVGAAWAVARFGRARRSWPTSAETRVTVVSPGRHADALRLLPVEALRVPGPDVGVLHDLNVYRVGELLALPRAGLATRFGADLLDCIDRALGALPEGLTPERPVDPVEAAWEFEPPVGDRNVLTAVIGHLLERLLKRLQPNLLGIQRLLCSLRPDGHDPIHFPVELLRPSATHRNLMELVTLRIDRLRPPAEIAAVTVRAAVVGPVGDRQDELFGLSSGSGRRDEMAGLIERLSSRLGDRAVLRPSLRADAQPECAFAFDPWLGVGPARPDPEDRPTVPLTRPVVLKSRPVPVVVLSVFAGGLPARFRWGDGEHRVDRSWGPERIETGWWRGADVRRDYYVVDTPAGHRFWLFRDLASGAWFLHGVYA